MNMRSTFKLSATLICGVVFIFFAVFVWPTRYRYDHINQNPIRIDRFTNEASYLDVNTGEWKSFRPLPVASDKLKVEPYPVGRAERDRPSPTPYPPYQPK
jgi:hypothetical protein